MKVLKKRKEEKKIVKRLAERLAFEFFRQKMNDISYDAVGPFEGDKIKEMNDKYEEEEIDNLTIAVKYAIMTGYDEYSIDERITLINSVISECRRYGFIRAEHVHALELIHDAEKLKSEMYKFSDKYAALTVLKSLGVDLFEL